MKADNKTPVQSYNAVSRRVHFLLTQIRKEVKKHKPHKPITWAYVGDLQHVESDLLEVLRFLNEDLIEKI